MGLYRWEGQYYQGLVGTLGVADVTLKWNKGGHFSDRVGGTARGFAWILNHLGEEAEG